MSTPERAGWYDDPEDDSQLRYFDGIIWSDRTVPRHAPARQPSATTDPTGQQPAPGTDVFGRPVAGGQPDQHASPEQLPRWGPAQQPGGGKQQSSEPTTEDGEPLAGYGERAGAYLIDLTIVSVLNMLLAGWAWWLFVADYMAYAQDLAFSDPGTTQMPTVEEVASMLNFRYFMIAIGITLVVEAAYHVGFLAIRNATPGKLLLGISVRRVGAPGRLGLGVSFMRMVLPLVLRLLWGVTCLFDAVVRAVDLLWPIKDVRRQALHDKIAGTQVVKGKQLREPKAQEPRP